ncbi:hypothetical protein Y032_0403g829 [Ancylostoma ceylanicum]|uniref:Uncharacterized protein n=1 Tax=Ancylostoma ceylanicum TaxID=53326 RepID=A0A016X3Y3_9BILA|nr:hypothetical protein Y032_0403g829 [Ancylostoma ceylanicum]
MEHAFISGGMQVEEEKKEALLFWMNTYGASLELEEVKSLQQLWRCHVPSLLNCLKTDRNTRVVAKTALDTYQELLSYLLTSNDQEKFTASLSAEKAAEGDQLEIAKFLAVLLNEFRIAKADVISASVAVMADRGCDLPLRDILNAFDEEQIEWWSVMVNRSPSTSPASRTLQFVTPRRPIYQAEEFTGMSVNRASFITPRCPSRRPESTAHTVARCDGSPLMDALNSPKVRELRRERDIRSLRKQVNELEDQLAMADRQATDSRRQIESLVHEISNKKSRIRELELSTKIMQQARDELEDKYLSLSKQLELSQRQNDSQKERLVAFKASAERWEDARIELTEQLKAKEDILMGLEREMRDIKDELYKTVQASRSIESDRNNLKRLLEELQKTAESEREQYQAAISDCRKRYEDEISKNVALYSEEMEKNAVLQRESRDKSERIEELQQKYENDKSALQRSFDDLKKSSQEKCEILTKRLNEAQAELNHLQERSRNMCQEHEETLRQLESVHLTEANQQNAQLSAARAHITELEEKLAKREQTILDHRKEFAHLSSEKDALEVAYKKAVAEMKMKDNELDEARRLIEKSSKEMESLKKKHLEAMLSFECLEAKTKQLESSMQEKETKLIELQKVVEELETLKEAHSEISEALKNAREDHESQKKQFEQVEVGMRETIEELKLKMCNAEQARAAAHEMIESLKQEWSSKEQELLDHNIQAKAENAQLTSRISDLEEDLVKEQSAKTELEGEVSECREELSSKMRELNELAESLCTAQSTTREQSDSIAVLKEELEATQKEEARLNDDCEKLREKDMQRSQQLVDLKERLQFIEDSVAFCNERSSKLEAENLSLKELIEMYDMAFMQSTRAEKRKSFASSLERSASLPAKKLHIDQQVLPLFTTSLDEPSMMETRSLLGPSDAVILLKYSFIVGKRKKKNASERVLEDFVNENFQDLEKEELFASIKIRIQMCYQIEVPTPSSWDDKDFLLKKIVQKCDAATSVSDLALISSTQAASESNLTSVVTGSDLSLATTTVSQGRQSFARSEFSRPSISGLSLDSRRRDDLSSSTDRSRLDELQKRNAMLPPSMRCAYATEVLGYGSPSGSENIVKHGPQSNRRKGKKLMERAASYVKKKLPLSESTNSIH